MSFTNAASSPRLWKNLAPPLPRLSTRSHVPPTEARAVLGIPARYQCRLASGRHAGRPLSTPRPVRARRAATAAGCRRSALPLLYEFCTVYIGIQLVDVIFHPANHICVLFVDEPGSGLLTQVPIVIAIVADPTARMEVRIQC